MYDIIAYFICVLFVASMKLAWFDTLLPVHVYHILHKFGFNLGIKNWDEFPHHESTREDWEIQITQGKYPILADLLMCPICLSFHLSFWCSLIVFSIGYFIGISIFIIPATVFTAPYIVNKILK